MTGYAAVVLAGGAARRMAGVDKPARLVGGRAMRDRVLDAVRDANPRIVVGPAGPLPAGVLLTRERPEGGGPVAATAAGLALLPPGATTVALLAGDLPLLTREALGELRQRLTSPTGPAASAGPDRSAGSGRGGSIDGACFVDAAGRRQSLCGLWRVGSLRVALDRLAAARGGTLEGASIRALLTGLAVLDVPWSGTGPPPWFDCDTDDDVRRAEEWTR